MLRPAELLATEDGAGSGDGDGIERVEQPDVGNDCGSRWRGVRGGVHGSESRGAVAGKQGDLGAEGEYGEFVQPGCVVEQWRVRAAEWVVAVDGEFVLSDATGWQFVWVAGE